MTAREVGMSREPEPDFEAALRWARIVDHGPNTCRNLARAYLAREAEMKRLREALRNLRVRKFTDGGGFCEQCRTTFYPGQPESHAAGCLAAPERT